MPRSTLTKHLGPGESRELLQPAEEVAVCVGQVSMQLAEVTVPLPDHYLEGHAALTPPAFVGAVGYVRIRATATLPPRAREERGLVFSQLPAVPLLSPDLELGNGPSSSQEPHLFDILWVPL